VVAGLTVFMNLILDREPPSQAQVQGPTPPEPTPRETKLPPMPKIELPPEIEDLVPPAPKEEASKPHPLPEKKPPAAGPRRGPLVAIVKSEPAVPQASRKIVVYLASSEEESDRPVYEYRLGGAGDWKPAPDARVQLADLKEGDLTLQVRVQNRHGDTSEPTSRTWTVQPPPVVPGRLEARLKPSDQFYQEVLVSRVSNFAILGLEMKSNVQYILVSRFDVKKRHEDGSLDVQQKVEGARLGNGDKNLEALVNGFLQKTKGANFNLHIDGRGRVTKFEGALEEFKVIPGAKGLGQETFLLFSLLDRDAWKELAEMTFFQPDKAPHRGVKWARKMSHSWGPLGGWMGQTVYACTDALKKVHQISFVHDMIYVPPGPGAGMGLPFQIRKADFKLQTANGALYFDVEQNRVTAAEERFQVRGLLAVSMLGIDSVVQMEEAQLFQVRITDKAPSSK
jgi:hypothetical protein